MTVCVKCQFSIISSTAVTLGAEKEKRIASLKGTSNSTRGGFFKLYYFEMSSLIENPYYSKPLPVMEGAQYLDVSIEYCCYVPYNVVELLGKSIPQDADI